MIKINDIELSFSNMGFFVTKEPWIHPARIIDSYEIIYVMEGNFDLWEDNKIYNLKPQSLFILNPGLKHKGIRKSDLPISFYWMHFYCKNFNEIGLFKLYHNAEFKNDSFLFRELMTLQQKNNLLLCDIKLAELLYTLSDSSRDGYSKVVSEIIEYIRLNAHKTLTVNEISSHFGYSNDHCSKMIKKHVGISLHSLINQNKINYIKMHLLNSNLPIKKIATLCGFEDENMFVKFFKYHAECSPSQYRNKHNGLKLNDH